MVATRMTRGHLWPLFELFDGTCTRYKNTIHNSLDSLIETSRKERGLYPQFGAKDIEKNSLNMEQSKTLLDELTRSIDGA
jgi:hypothetical protein